ncbi:hypothetical protein QFC20_001671 [Naganishia adeliensis]|uniref:Uncharacterized protein n=1 Tax=Naganishia adeliensis TaxID=92952 RepID=A0ACC2WS78_9TREE|nr:hypothetical protein QFC20_001671 [Naganishia adeliensis]
MPTSTSPLALSNLFSVESKIVVVTGGGTGIGRMISESFAVNGSKVYITGRRKDVLEKTAEEINAKVKGQSGTGQVVAIQGDVSSKAKVKEFHAQIAALEDKLDVLINCAGVLIPFNSPAKDHNDVNVAGPYFVTTAFAPMLTKSDNASVINIASIAPMALQKYGIRVNAIAPGLFRSYMTGDGTNLAPHVQQVVHTVPAGRVGDASDIAGPCIMLASTAGAYINNATIVVDGGRLMTLSSMV